jgi:hypothetical protein
VLYACWLAEHYLCPASAAPVPQFWTESAKPTLLRSVTGVLKNQPDALEWLNNGEVQFVLSPSTHEVPVLCNVMAFGTWSSVTGNRARAAVRCAEGDSCLQRTETAVLLVPTIALPLQEPILTSHVAHTTTKARSRIAPARGMTNADSFASTAAMPLGSRRRRTSRVSRTPIQGQARAPSVSTWSGRSRNLTGSTSAPQR